MKERPIIFSAPMVRAILEGRKSQTRRIVKAPIDFLGAGGSKGEDWNDPRYWGWEDLENPSHFGVLSRYPEKGDWSIRCPYGVPGDRLWVRETWSQDHRDFYPSFPIVYRADGYPAEWEIENGTIESPEVGRRFPFKWRSSMFMPRWASRITLEVTDVRVERLQNISEADAEAEGIQPFERCAGQSVYRWHGVDSPLAANPVSAYATLWESINGKDSWDANPWIWALSFKRIEPVT